MDRLVVFLNRRQRLPQFAAQLGSRIVDSSQNVLLSIRTHLLLREHVSRLAVGSVEADHIFNAQIGN
jgi:hypothetical protein